MLRAVLIKAPASIHTERWELQPISWHRAVDRKVRLSEVKRTSVPAPSRADLARGLHITSD